MKNFFWILRNYLKRNFLYPANYLVIGLPLVFIVAFQLIDNFINTLDTGGDVLGFGGLAMLIVLSFQFFGADLTTDYLHADLKGSTRLRLFVSGNDQRVFFFAVVISGWLFNTLMGIFLVAITSLVPLFDADWGNYIFVILAILFLSFLVQLVGVLIFNFTKDEKSGSKFSYIFGEIMMGIALFPAIFNLPAVVERIFNFLPIELGLQIAHATTFLNALPYFGILLAMNIVLAVVVFLVGRRRNNDSF